MSRFAPSLFKSIGFRNFRHFRHFRQFEFISYDSVFQHETWSLIKAMIIGEHL